MPIRGRNRVVLTTHELGLSARRWNDPIRSVVTGRLDEYHNHARRIAHMSAQRPTLKQLKRTPLTVLPCENNCAEERCEHYRDCQSLVLMTQYLIDINVDPALLAEVERGRDRTLENWTKKGILRGCMFKVPHATKEDAQHHVNVLKQGDPNSNYFWYPCRYSPEDKTHYHVAHSNASIGSLIRSGRGKKYAHYVENQ